MVGRRALVQTPFLIDSSYWSMAAAYGNLLYDEIKRTEKTKEQASLEKTVFERKLTPLSSSTRDARVQNLSQTFAAGY